VEVAVVLTLAVEVAVVVWFYTLEQVFLVVQVMQSLLVEVVQQVALEMIQQVFV
tara:strand:+ start:83 stop:244 length:162 start_codon:yes stop_codon:yes gene_type:complete